MVLRIDAVVRVSWFSWNGRLILNTIKKKKNCEKPIWKFRFVCKSPVIGKFHDVNHLSKDCLLGTGFTEKCAAGIESVEDHNFYVGCFHLSGLPKSSLYNTYIYVYVLSLYIYMYMYIMIYIYTVYIMETRCKLPFLALDLEARIKGSWNWVQALNNWDIIYI